MVQFSLARYKSVAFFGLGNMGRHMATNLLAAQHHVTIFDTNSKALDYFKEQKNVRMATNPENAINQSNFVVLMLPTSKIVRDVCQSNIFPIAKKGTFIIDCSTIDVRTSVEMAEIARNKQLHFIDAPVSGGVIGAEKGTLTFMVGGELHEFKTAKPILDKMGKNIVHVGPNGSGLSAKICNNLLAAISMIATSEAMSLGIKLGLDKTILAKLINSSTGQCWSSQIYNPCPGIIPNVPSNNNYDGGCATEIIEKDLLIALDLAKDVQVLIPLTKQATKIYQQICSNDLNKKDFSIVFKHLHDQH